MHFSEVSSARFFVANTGGEDGIARGITVSGNDFHGSIEGAISPHAQGYDIAIIGNHISDSNMGPFPRGTYMPSKAIILPLALDQFVTHSFLGVGIVSRSPNTVISGNTVVNWGEPNTSTVTGTISMQCAIYSTELGGTNLIVKDNTLLYDGDRYRGLINGQKIYGTAVEINGLISDDGQVEFANEYVVIEGNTISGLPGGGAGIAVGFATAGAGVVTPAASPFAPMVLRVERNSILAPTHYDQISITGDQERTRGSVKGNTLHVAGAASRQISAVSLRSLNVQGNAFGSAEESTAGGGLMAFSNISTLRVSGNELAAEVAGCIVASVSNVTAHSVQSCT